MRNKLRIVGLAVLFGSAAMLPSLAKADSVNQETTVELGAPVEVPGAVLPPGQYVFKLADSQASRNIVQIFNQDQSQILATVLAIPAYRPEATGEPAIVLEERPEGNPEAIGEWFFAGESEGVQFVYQP
jgi:hypothetical protein